MKLATINIPNDLKVNQEQFEQLAIANRDLRLERTAYHHATNRRKYTKKKYRI